MLIVSRAMKLTGLKADLEDGAAEILAKAFRDAGDISRWAVSGAAEAYAAGIVNGKPDGRIDPGALITRAEAAAIIQRLLKQSDLI